MKIYIHSPRKLEGGCGLTDKRSTCIHRFEIWRWIGREKLHARVKKRIFRFYQEYRMAIWDISEIFHYEKNKMSVMMSLNFWNFPSWYWASLVFTHFAETSAEIRSFHPTSRNLFISVCIITLLWFSQSNLIFATRN